MYTVLDRQTDGWTESELWRRMCMTWLQVMTVALKWCGKCAKFVALMLFHKRTFTNHTQTYTATHTDGGSAIKNVLKPQYLVSFVTTTSITPHKHIHIHNSQLLNTHTPVGICIYIHMSLEIVYNFIKNLTFFSPQPHIVFKSVVLPSCCMVSRFEIKRKWRADKYAAL